jgi:hypothetical protein
MRKDTGFEVVLQTFPKQMYHLLSREERCLVNVTGVRVLFPDSIAPQLIISAVAADGSYIVSDDSMYFRQVRRQEVAGKTETETSQVAVKMSTGDAIQLYNILHTVIRSNREELEDAELDFLGEIKKKLSDAVNEHDRCNGEDHNV